MKTVIKVWLYYKLNRIKYSNSLASIESWLHLEPRLLRGYIWDFQCKFLTQKANSTKGAKK